MILFHMLTIGDGCSVNTVYCGTDCLSTVFSRRSATGYHAQTLLDMYACFSFFFVFFLLDLLHIPYHVLLFACFSHLLLLTKILCGKLSIAVLRMALNS